MRRTPSHLSLRRGGGGEPPDEAFDLHMCERHWSSSLKTSSASSRRAQTVFSERRHAARRTHPGQPFPKANFCTIPAFWILGKCFCVAKSAPRSPATDSNSSKSALRLPATDSNGSTRHLPSARSGWVEHCYMWFVLNRSCALSSTVMPNAVSPRSRSPRRGFETDTDSRSGSRTEPHASHGIPCWCDTSPP